MADEERRVRRVSDADTPPGVKAAAEARRALRETPGYREALARDIAAVREEFPPKRRKAVDGERTAVRRQHLVDFLAAFRAERERQGLSLGDVSSRTGIDGATISKLERGVDANPTVETLQVYAHALGKRLVLSMAEAEA